MEEEIIRAEGFDDHLTVPKLFATYPWVESQGVLNS